MIFLSDSWDTNITTINIFSVTSTTPPTSTIANYWQLVKLDISTSVIQIPTTTTPPIIPKKITKPQQSVRYNLNSRYGTSRRPALFHAVLVQIPTTTTPPIIPKKKSRNLNLNSRYGTSRRSALLVVASYDYKHLLGEPKISAGFQQTIFN